MKAKPRCVAYTPGLRSIFPRRNLGSSKTSMLAITIDARSIVPIADAYAQAGIAAPIAIARALNWTGNKARTHVARTLARDTGVGYGVIRHALRTTPASPAKLTYEGGVSGAHIHARRVSCAADTSRC